MLTYKMMMIGMLTMILIMVTTLLTKKLPLSKEKKTHYSNADLNQCNLPDYPSPFTSS